MEKYKYHLSIVAILCSILILFCVNIKDFFLSDDFVFLFYSHFFTIWTNPLLAIRPFATIIFEAQNSIFGFEPQGYHLINIGIHIFNSYLVYFIIKELTNNENTSIIGSLMFATFPISSETVIWISAQSDLWMTAFILLSFFSYLKYNKQSKLIWLILSLIYFSFAILSREIAIIFILIFFSYDVFFDESFIKYFKESTEPLIKLKKIGKYCIKYLPFLAIIIILYPLFIFYKKVGLNFTPYFKFASFLDFFPNSFFPLFLDNSNLYKILFFVSFFSLIVCFIFIFKSQNKVLKLSLIWIIIIIAGFALFNLTSIDIYFYLLILSLNAVPQGRFLYVIAVGVVIFYSNILALLYKKKFNTRFKLPISRKYIFSSFVFFLLIGNSFLIFSQNYNWKRASRISYNILIKTFNTVPVGTESVNIYFINVPDHINNPFGPSWNTFFIFRNGLEEIAHLFYPNCKIFSFNMIYHKKILDFELPDWRIPISEIEFDRFSNDSSNVILFFNPVTELLIDVSDLNYTDFDPYPFLGIPKFEYWFN
ncbi:MAG: glycosyltransferase family 39 protein [Candidatus Hodarchaeota archaeon]